MKFLLAKLFITLIPTIVMSQSNFNKSLAELRNLKLISNQESDALVKQIKEVNEYRKKNGYDYEEPDYTITYNKLNLLVQAKQFSTSGTSSAFSFMPAPRSTRMETDDQLYNELKDFINKLAASNLITKETVEVLNEKNNKHLFAWQIEVAQEAYRITNEEYFLRPKHFIQYLRALFKEDMIDEASFEKLSGLSHGDSLHQYAEIYPYLKRSVIIDLKTLKGDYTTFLSQLYQKTAAVLPGLSFEKILFKDVINKRESFDDFIAHDLSVSFYVDTQKYSFTSYYDFESAKKATNPQMPGRERNNYSNKIPDEYYQIFNKVLADHLSAYKLHSFAVDEDFIGIIALTEKQTREVMWTYDGALTSYLNISYEDYNAKMTTRKIKNALNLYACVGLFSAADQAQKDSLVEEINSSDIGSYTDILRKFDNILVDLDAEYGVDDGQYKFITEKLAYISNGHFAPHDIVDTYTYNNKNFDYGFTLKGKTYKIRLHQEDDWLDWNFWALIKKAVDEQDSQGRFYELRPTDGLTAVYLTNEQYKILKEKNVLEFSDEGQ